MTKPTISPAAGIIKEEGQDQKNFHYIYILKKQASAEESKPAKEEAEGKAEVEQEPEEQDA